MCFLLECSCICCDTGETVDTVDSVSVYLLEKNFYGFEGRCINSVCADVDCLGCDVEKLERSGI
jgi:hypothetical protein